MKKAILLGIILIFACDELIKSELIRGCTLASACNYVPGATEDDGSCLEFDCADVCGGNSYLDDCGVCDDDVTNDNTTCGLSESDCTDENEICSYATHIQPIFDMHCTKCHGSNGGLDLTSYPTLMSGGLSGQVIITSDSEHSLLLLRITNPINPMPPAADSYMLDDIYTNMIAKWIDAGAINN